MKDKTILLIVGSSGSGKTYASQYLAKEWDGVNLISSYTTRPMREGEVDGVDHIFTDLEKFVRDHTEGTIVAATNYGNHKYWTTKDQFEGISAYVVDEEGILYMEREFSDFANFIKIYIASKEEVREARGVSLERRVRDNDRKALPIDIYDFVITNNGSLGKLNLALDIMMAEVTKMIRSIQ